MKKLIFAILLLTAFDVNAGTAFFQYEVQTGGMTKQCVYNYLGSTYTLTVKSISICPLTIQV